jgi:transposase-like protein
LYPVSIRTGFERLEIAKPPVLKKASRMNSHKHARLTYARRLEMARQMTLEGLSATDAALLHGVTPPTARKWLGRYLAGGESALADASSRPARSPRAIEASTALLIVGLRRRCLTQARIARSVGVCDSVQAQPVKKQPLDASQLGCVMRVRDSVRHLGDDALVCLLGDGSDREQVLRLVSKLADAVSVPVTVGAVKLTVRPTIGIATNPAEGASAEILLRRADAAMTRAKRQQTTYAFFDERIDG